MNEEGALSYLRDMERRYPKQISLLFQLMENRELDSLFSMANLITVEKLGYNDHGKTHAIIVSAYALQIHELLPVSYDSPDPLTVILLGSYLHDLGNAIHRQDHPMFGVVLAQRFLNHLPPEIRSHVLHAVYSHDESVEALTAEAGVVKVADGCDMEKGRARYPYSGEDMHALSARSVERVEIKKGEERPVRIEVSMKNEAGVFQIEYVLLRKIKTSRISEFFEVVAKTPEREYSYFP